jgi:hypothetical protein
VKSRSSKLSGDGKPSGTLESLDSLAGAGAKHAIGFKISVPKICERFLCRTDLLL